MRRHLAPLSLIIVSIVIVYHGWFLPGAITYGDWGYYTAARMHDFWPIPTLWDSSSGFGGANILAGPLFPLLFLHGLLNQLGADFALSERLIWIFPGLLGGALVTYALAFAFFSSRLAGVIGALFMVFNSYIAVIMVGGQFTVSGGYFLMPLSLLLFYRTLCHLSLGRLALVSICIVTQVMYDLRSTYLTMGFLLLFTFYYSLAQRRVTVMLRAFWRAGITLAVVGVVVVFAHAFWLLPSHYAEKLALPAGYDSLGWVHTLSYMQVGHGLALFHPFWSQQSTSPHVAPVEPVFFVLPLLIFAPLLRRRVTYAELFLCSLALLAVFFVKGANPPAGFAYDWLFVHLPGFSAYRDPSKFYQPLALAYALLLSRAATVLPLPSLTHLATLRALTRLTLPVASLGLVLVLVLPVATPPQWGTLTPVRVPVQFDQFDQFLDQQHTFSRVLWASGADRFVVSTASHPFLNTDTIDPKLWGNALPIPSNPSSWLLLPNAQSMLDALSVKYIAVEDQIPNASAQDKQARAKAIAFVHQAFPSFPQLHVSGIRLFLNKSYLSRIFVPSAARFPSFVPRIAGVQYRSISKLGDYKILCHSCIVMMSQTRTRYEIVLHNTTHSSLVVLNEAFDPNWHVYVEPTSSPQPFWWTWTHPGLSSRYHVKANGFANAWWITTTGGTHRVVIEYWPQRLTDVGFMMFLLIATACITIATVPPALRRAHAQKTRDILDLRSSMPSNDRLVGSKVIEHEGARSRWRYPILRG